MEGTSRVKIISHYYGVNPLSTSVLDRSFKELIERKSTNLTVEGKMILFSPNEATIIPTHTELQDFKPFSSVFSPANISMQLLKGLVVPLNIFLNDYNHYIDSIDLRAQKKPAPYDWEGAKKKFLDRFLPDSLRFLSTSILGKILEEIVHQKYPAFVLDQLTKNVYKSLLRKSIRFQSRWEVSKRIFFTYLKSNSLSYLSMFLYDSTAIIIDSWYKSYQVYKKKRDILSMIKSYPLFQTIMSIVKQCIGQCLAVTSASAGYAIGSYFNLHYGGVTGSLIGELVVIALFSPFLGPQQLY
jgi:hypothetical protein